MFYANSSWYLRHLLAMCVVLPELQVVLLAVPKRPSMPMTCSTIEMLKTFVYKKNPSKDIQKLTL